MIADIIASGPDSVIIPVVIGVGIVAAIAIVAYLILRRIKVKNVPK